MRLLPERALRLGRQASLDLSRSSRVAAYSFLATLAVAAATLVTITLRHPESATVIDTRIESGHHLTFVLVAQEVAPGTRLRPTYVTQVRAARDSLRALAAREGIYYSTVGIAQHWDIAEGLRVLDEYGPFDEVSVGRGWFNTAGFRYHASTVPGVLVFLDDIAVGQTSWTSRGLVEVMRVEGYRSMRDWVARGFFLNLDGLGTVPQSAMVPREGRSATPVASEPSPAQSEHSAAATWQLGTSVVASVGGTEADPLYRVVGAAIAPRHVVVAEASTGSLRFYTHGGRVEATVGKEGEGPGEFRNMAWMNRVDDEIHVFDRSSMRLDVYSFDGTLVRAVSVRPLGELPLISVVGSFGDGSLLTLGSSSPLHLPNEPETHRVPLTLLRYDSASVSADRLIDVVGPERYYERDGRGVTQMFTPFGPGTGIGIVDSSFVVADNESYAISVHGRDGAQLETLVPDPLPLPVSLKRADIESVRDAILANANEASKRFLEGMLRATASSDHLPPYGWFGFERGNRRPPLIVADGFVYALRYGGIASAGGGIAGPEWFVFRPDEGHVATLTSPDDVRLLDLKGDLAAVLRKTELGEEVVELRRVLGR